MIEWIERQIERGSLTFWEEYLMVADYDEGKEE